MLTILMYQLLAKNNPRLSPFHCHYGNPWFCQMFHPDELAEIRGSLVALIPKVVSWLSPLCPPGEVRHPLTLALPQAAPVLLPHRLQQLRERNVVAVGHHDGGGAVPQPRQPHARPRWVPRRRRWACVPPVVCMCCNVRRDEWATWRLCDVLRNF